MSEQLVFADLLDRKIAAIGEAVRNKERMLELLDEQRQSFITEGVTGAIAGLSSSAASWPKAKLKHMMQRIVDCPHSTPEYSEDGEFPAIRTADISRGILDLSSAYRVSGGVYRDRVERLIPRAGDIIYSREGERFGMAALAPPEVKLCLAQRVMLFRTKGDQSPEFWMWMLNSRLCAPGAWPGTIGRECAIGELPD